MVIPPKPPTLIQTNKKQITTQGTEKKSVLFCLCYKILNIVFSLNNWNLFLTVLYCQIFSKGPVPVTKMVPYCSGLTWHNRQMGKMAGLVTPQAI